MEKSINELYYIIQQAVSHIGFSALIPVSDRPHHLRGIKYGLIAIWIISSLLGLSGTINRIYWLFMVVLCLFLEQGLNFFYCWCMSLLKKQSSIQFLTESAYRSLFQRFNLIYFFLFSVLVHRLKDLTFGSLELYLIPGVGVATLLIIENTFYKKQSIIDKLDILFLSLFRIKNQLITIFSSGIGIITPSIIIIFILSAISQDLWKFINEMTWLQIAILTLFIIIFVLIPSTSNSMKVIDEKIRSLEIEKHPFSSERLFHAVIRCIPLERYKSINRSIFDIYSEYSCWKLTKTIYQQELQNIINECQRRVSLHVFLSVLILTPLIVVFVYIITTLLFPLSIIKDWTGTSFNLQFLSLDTTALSLAKWEDISANPIAKFSCVTSLLLLANLVVGYSQNSRQMLTNLGVNGAIISDWLTILCAYKIIKETDFQLIGTLYTPVRQGVYYILPLVLVPDMTDIENLVRVTGIANHIFINKSLNQCAILMRKMDFLKTTTAITMGITDDTTTPSSIFTMFNPTMCWAWLGEGFIETGIWEFKSLYEAQEWIGQRLMNRGKPHL